MTKHTEISKWRWEWNQGKGEYYIYAPFDDSPCGTATLNYTGGDAEDKLKAIVQACNNHSRLVETLRTLSNELRIHDKDLGDGVFIRERDFKEYTNLLSEIKDGK